MSTNKILSHNKSYTLIATLMSYNCHHKKSAFIAAGIESYDSTLSLIHMLQKRTTKWKQLAIYAYTWNINNNR